MNKACRGVDDGDEWRERGIADSRLGERKREREGEKGKERVSDVAREDSGEIGC